MHRYTAIATLTLVLFLLGASPLQAAPTAAVEPTPALQHQQQLQLKLQDYYFGASRRGCSSAPRSCKRWCSKAPTRAGKTRQATAPTVLLVGSSSKRNARTSQTTVSDAE
jgi:hypothetical protein